MTNLSSLLNEDQSKCRTQDPSFLGQEIIQESTCKQKAQYNPKQ